MVSFEQNRKKDPMVSWTEGSVPQVQVFRSCQFRLHWRRHNAVSVRIVEVLCGGRILARTSETRHHLTVMRKERAWRANPQRKRPAF
jgi:hypothetical protein